MAQDLPEKFERIVQDSSIEWLEKRGMTRDELRSFIEKRVIRDKELSPKVGTNAPDIKVESLDKQGKRTGKDVSLSSYFGKPTALIFGSYT